MNRRGGRGHQAYRARVFNTFVAAQRYVTCGRCGNRFTIPEGAHPTRDGSKWCLSGSLSEPPREAAEAWYGPLPDWTPWEQWRREGH